MPRTGSSSGKAIFEDEMGPNPVSSSGKAVYEDEMGLAEGSPRVVMLRMMARYISVMIFSSKVIWMNTPMNMARKEN